MSRNTLRKPAREMPSEERKTQGEMTEDRRRKLEEILSHQGRIELDIDPERLVQLRSSE